MPRPLEGLLVIAIEQAVAAPMASCRLADAGARVVKIERAEGDFARGYDDVVHGESAYFVWLNRGKESLVLDFTRDDDRALLERLIARADVVVQNLKPGALGRLGLAPETLRARFPKLIVASISGYGEEGPYAQRKAYDLLVQAEAGLASLTGGPEGAARVGVSVVDIATGMMAYEAILEALIGRGRTGEGADIRVSMFDAMADWCTVPLLQHEGGKSPKRMGLRHPSIAPYGVFRTRDGAELLIATQSDREWRILAERLIGQPELGTDADFATNVRRVENRAATDAVVAEAVGRRPVAEVVALLAAADIAFGQVNDMAGLAAHPHLRRIVVDAPSGPVTYPAPAARRPGAVPTFGAVPALGQHTASIRDEFAP